MAYSDPGAVTGGSTPARATWANAVRDDLVNHESRIVTLEAAAVIAIVSPTDAQIKSWPTGSGITLVGAPGSNKVIVPIWTMFAFKSGGTAYGNVNQNANISADVGGQDYSTYIVNNATVSPDITDVNSLMKTVGGDTFARIIYPYQDDRGYGVNAEGLLSYVGTLSSIINQPLVTHFENHGAGALTGGNASNAWRFITKYSVVDLT
jgi:hypothetical protein